MVWGKAPSSSPHMKSAVGWMTVQLSSGWWFSRWPCFSPWVPSNQRLPHLHPQGKKYAGESCIEKGVFTLSSDTTLILLDRFSHAVPSHWKEAGSGCPYAQAQKTDAVCDEPMASTLPHRSNIFLDLQCLLVSLNMPKAYCAFYPLSTFPANSHKTLLVG